MKILGLNSAGYSTSSTLIVDGNVVFAAEEERLIREKRTRQFPIQGIRAALKRAGLQFEDLDAVAIGWNPAINLESFNKPQADRARYLGEIFYSVPSNLMRLKKDNRAELSEQTLHFMDGTSLRIFYVTHHLSHAASFFVSPFERAAVFTVDAFGEKTSTMFAQGVGNKLKVLWSQDFPQSLGSFYATFTEYLGFQPQSDEWKLMGASSYGDGARFRDKVRSVVRLHDDGFELDLSCFNHYQFHRPLLYTPKLTTVLGIAPNEFDTPLSPAYYDLAAAAQDVFEEIYFHLLRLLHKRTGEDAVVLAGGSALNSVANGKVLRCTPFKHVFIPSVPDDSGCSLGAAYYVYHQVFDCPRRFVMRTNYFGPGYSDQEIRSTLTKLKIQHRVVDDPSQAAAELIAGGKIVGWFQGQLEFGDRALGNRSILADPRDESMKDKVNETVKYREPFRPFAPSILADYVDEYFDGAVATPFMEKVFPVRSDKRHLIPAVTHVDGSGRLQTVTREVNPRYWALIEAFRRITQVPVVLNTSFNLKGEAIVASPQDAVRTFYSSGLDALVLGDCVVEKGN